MTPNINLYDYQQQAEGLLRETDRNLLIIAPTGAGKTESGFTGLEIAGKGVLVEPTRALCYEKAGWLRQRFPEARVRVGNKDYSLSLGGWRDSHMRVLTPWKLAVILHNDSNFTASCPLVVLDEVHNLDPETELILTKMKLLFPQVRLVGLSATIHEEDEPKLASWLNAAVVKSDVRPVPLVTRIAHFDSDLDDSGEEITNVAFTEGNKAIGSRQLEGFANTETRVAAVVDQIRNSGDNSPVLVYTPYRERARHIAEHLAERLGYGNTELETSAKSLPNEAGDFTTSLKTTLPKSVGIHHGGMTQQERETVFELALAGKLSVVVCCETLIQGVNLPARHVIIESIYQEPEGGGERQLISASRFWQALGRAGRPQFDTIGYAWVITTSEIEVAEVEEILLKQKASRIESRVYDEYFLTAHVAGLMQLGYTSAKKLVGFLRQTFFGSTLADTQPLVEQMERIIRRLIAEQFAMPVGKMIVLTDRGQRLARLGMHPAEYSTIEALVREQNVEYDTWVRQLIGACGEYVLARHNKQPDEEIIGEVVTFGMTAYSVKTSWACRELVDYVSRLLELSMNFLRFNDADADYVRRFKEEVLDRFNFGQIEVARRLSAVLPSSAVKRVLRNCGPTFGAARLPVEEGEGEQSNELVFDEPALRCIAKSLWSQTDMPPNGTCGKVAGVLGVTEARFRRIAETTLQEVANV